MPNTQVNLTISLDESSINPNALPALLEVLSDLEPILLDEIATYWQEQEQEVFDTEGASIGQPWAPLAASTLKQKANHNPPYPAQPLVRTGRLAAQIGQSIALTGNSVLVGIDTDVVPYASYHDQGAGRLPQRVLIGCTDDQVQELEDRLQVYLQQQTGLGADVIRVSEGY